MARWGLLRWTPNQDSLRSPAPPQDMSTKCHLGLSKFNFFHQPPAWPASSRSPPRGATGSIFSTDQPRQAPLSMLAGGWGAQCGQRPGTPMVVGLGLSGASERLVWMVSASGNAAPSPVGWSWSFCEQGWTGWDGVGGTGARPGQDQTRRYTQPAVWLPRVTSSSFSLSPSLSGQRGLCPCSPAPCQHVSQPLRPGDEPPRRRVLVNSLAWPSPLSGACEAHRQSPGQSLSAVGTSQGEGQTQGAAAAEGPPWPPRVAL